MAAHVGACLSLAARLRRPGTGTFLGPARALSATLCRRQYAGCQLHDACELFSYFAPPIATRYPQTAHPDVTKIAAAPQARIIKAQRFGDWQILSSPLARRCRNR